MSSCDSLCDCRKLSDTVIRLRSVSYCRASPPMLLRSSVKAALLFWRWWRGKTVVGKGRLLDDKPGRSSVAGKPALPIRCGVFHTRLIRGCPQWQATQGSSLFGGWQANLAKHVAVSATLTFATPQAAYANPLRSANFYIMQDRYAQCSRPKSIAHKGHYAKVGW